MIHKMIFQLLGSLTLSFLRVSNWACPFKHSVCPTIHLSRLSFTGVCGLLAGPGRAGSGDVAKELTVWWCRERITRFQGRTRSLEGEPRACEHPGGAQGQGGGWGKVDPGHGGCRWHDRDLTSSAGVGWPGVGGGRISSA